MSGPSLDTPSSNGTTVPTNNGGPTDPIPHSVAETLQVTTSDNTDPVSQPVPASSIPTVGASISVPTGDTNNALANDRSSSALLSLASSCSLTEILNAQQQALEQFQCQLQLAQQTEAINQRLDAIERTLNSLIQQRAQEEAAKNAAVVAAAAAVTPITPAQLRPSQQLQLPSNSPPGSEGKKKLPRELCSKVRSTYNSLSLQFKIDERFLSPANQHVTDTLIDQIYTDSGGVYNVKDIKRAVHRYYESRRRIGIEELPDRQEKAAEQKKRRKYRARQQRAYDRRKRYVRESEMKYWECINPACMTEESDAEDGEGGTDKIINHRLVWRSEFLNMFFQKLDSRYERARKPGPGVSANARRERIEGQPSTSQPPPDLPSWMLDTDYHQVTGISVTLTPNASQTQLIVTTPLHDAALVETSTVTDEVSYSSLIDMHEVKDDSSDFELPEHMVVDNTVTTVGNL